MSSDSKFNIRRAVILRLNLHFATEPIKTGGGDCYYKLFFVNLQIITPFKCESRPRHISQAE